MSNYKDLSSEELKRTLAEKQDILRRTMKPDEYKKFMQELDDCQIIIDYSKFGKPVQYPETKKEKRQRKKEERILSKASREKPKILLFFATVLTKIFPLFLTIYTLAVIPILFLVWQIYKLISADSWQAIFHTTKTIYVVGYIVIFFALTRLQTALYTRPLPILQRLLYAWHNSPWLSSPYPHEHACTLRLSLFPLLPYSSPHLTLHIIAIMQVIYIT
ncbi:MAG: hypothetical protein UDS09_11020 [Oscillospiraceae bacterium]|nr:hypothetical protein [Oscillospiraceae bacterium]